MQKNPLLTKETVLTILGLGVSGMAALRYALAHGVCVRVSDLADKESIEKKLASCGAKGLEIEAGEHSYDFLATSDIVFVSPGATCDGLLSSLQKAGVKLVGELSLAAEVHLPPVIGITGTNGKTTVTSLVGDLLMGGGKKVYVGGNIGYPLLDFLCSGEEVDYLVLELSSFQLEYSDNFNVHMGLLLNITPDHLDRHGDMDGYRDAKMKLFAHQTEGDFALYYGDDSFCEPHNFTKGQCVGFGEKTNLIQITDNGFSFDLSGNSEKYDLKGTPFGNRTGKLNAGPASYIARLLGTPKNVIERVIAEFDLGEHRMELAGVVNGVSYYNDSKATNTGAVISGLSQLEEVVLIAGGRDKGDDYSLLRRSVADKVCHLILIGEASSLIKPALSDIVSIYEAESLQDAMDEAHRVAEPGQSVLFAPACSSFDMFANYKDRGDKFKDQVARLLSESEAV